MSFGEKTWQAMKAFFAKLWAIIKGLSAKTLGVLLAIVVLAVVAVLIALGFKNLRMGGILGWLLGKTDDSRSVIDQANTVDPQRVDPSGKPIPIGQPDSKGITQVPVLPIQDPGLFSDPNKVVIQPPNSDKPVVVVLPDGVKNSEVDQVVVITPTVTDVIVTDKSEVSKSEVDDLLSKFRGSK